MDNIIDDDFFNEELLFEKDYIKASRAKKAHQARKKVEAYLERKRFKHFYDDVKDIDWDAYD